MRDLKTENEIMARWQGDSDQPLVSINCITYNHENYIEDALEGFLIQETDFPFEILIHDDASTDRTADIIREYETRFPNILKPIYQSENQYSKGIKPGIQYNYPRAKGKYIAICEGDDYWTDHNKLQIQVDFLETHPDYVISYHPCITFDENGETDRYTKYAAKRDLSQEELKKATPIHTRTVCFRNCIKQFPPEINSARIGDLFLWSLLGNFGKGKYLPDIKPAYYRVHEGGIFSNIHPKNAVAMILSTKIALFSYYNNIGDSVITKYYAESILPVLIRIVGKKIFLNLLWNTLVRRVFKFVNIIK